MYLGFYMFSTIATIQISIIYAQTDTAACNSCCTAGVPGIPGNHGNPGVSGPQGMNGVKGEQGIKGEVGMKGEQGIKGDNGRNGLDGIPGKLGPQGLIGPSGVNGVKGEKGEQGPQGLIGSVKGEQASQQKSAFSVVFTTNPGRHAVSPMKYNTIITDVGNHYNKETGKFVCTIPGVYVFQVTSLKSSGGGIVSTQIIKNGNFQVTAYVGDTGHHSISTMVVLDLVSGDQVWTQPRDTNTNYYYSDGNRYCSFSGFLLYAA
ncbi:complement C1q tumor necrosis factor-related protein 2-like [Antedon mediterranea]|uniref:complement C1q tumor necrosis factor-related protein 2-like n=1 Tax=Antedon mediterranea TaxID=105859 RepID=UPI003AF60B38